MRQSLLLTFTSGLALMAGAERAGAQDDAEAQPTTQVADEARVSEATINRLLDGDAALTVSNRPLPEVLAEITRQTNVPFQVPDETWHTLPYGMETPISVSVTATPLRQTIAAIAQRLGLQYVARDGRVEMLPLPSLRRVGRRTTVEEVAMLDLLSGLRLDLVEDRPTVAQLLEAVDLALEEVDSAAQEAGRTQPGYVVDNRLPDMLRERPVFVSRDATLASAMEAIAQQTAATWYPDSAKLIVLPKDEWVLRALDRPVRLAYERAELQQVIDDLERLAGLPFRIAPGSLAKVEPRFQQVRLYLEEATIRQALDSLGGITGLAWEVDSDGVYLDHVTSDGFEPGRPRAAVAGFRNAELPVLLVDLGDGRSLLVYESELPREARERLARKRADAVDALVRGEPTSRPAE
ncbi:MAG: hypothetical protein AAGI46_04910 [Planctomycetota bacterium]